MSKRDEVKYIAMAGIVERCTPKAVLLILESADMPVWVPRSVCEGGDDLVVKDEDIRIADWWLRKNGLEDVG
jgi:hypothetical protein